MKIEGQPRKGYTKEDWAKDFAAMKNRTKQSAVFQRMPVIADKKRKNETYHGKTQYQYYCSFINDILQMIRKGECDYCYTFYQVEELLKYEHDRLVAEWLPNFGCFKLSLKM